MGQERLETVMSIICIVDKLREIKSEGIDFSKVIDLHDQELKNDEVIELTNAPKNQAIHSSQNAPILNASIEPLNFY